MKLMNIFLVNEVNYFYSPTLDKKYRNDAYITVKAFDNLADANKFVKESTIKKFKHLMSEDMLKKYIPDEPTGEKAEFIKTHKIGKSVPEKLILDFMKVFNLEFYFVSEIPLHSIYS
jgi:hypothetical protein